MQMRRFKDLNISILATSSLVILAPGFGHQRGAEPNGLAGEPQSSPVLCHRIADGVAGELTLSSSTCSLSGMPYVRCEGRRTKLWAVGVVGAILRRLFNELEYILFHTCGYAPPMTRRRHATTT